MTYYVSASYTMSNLGALEKKALPWLKVLQDKIITDGQIPAVKDGLNALRGRLEMENPRCKGVSVSVSNNGYSGRLFISFGYVTYIGTPCEPLDTEKLKF